MAVLLLTASLFALRQASALLPFDRGGGSLNYFAFGSNMHPAVLEGMRGITPLRRWPAQARGWRLGFTLRGSRNEPSLASAEPDARASMWGVLYELDRASALKILATEGVPLAYLALPLRVTTSDGDELDAFTLTATPGPLRSSRDAPPSLRYLTYLREGARIHGLPQEWVDYLDNLEPDTSAVGGNFPAADRWERRNVSPGKRPDAAAYRQNEGAL